MCRRPLWQAASIRWDHDMRGSNVLEISVHSPKWDPRPGLNFNTWRPESRKLVHVSAPWCYVSEIVRSNPRFLCRFFLFKNF